MKGVNRPLIVLSLRELADESLQRELWLGRRRDEISYFVEAVLGVFDDSALAFELERGQSEFGGAIDAEFSKLRRVCDAIGHDISQEEVIGHPEMPCVRSIAKRILCMIDSCCDSTVSSR